MKVTRWEYKTVLIEGDNSSSLDEILNHYGAKGWELVSFNDNNSPITCAFKRPVFGRLPDKD